MALTLEQLNGLSDTQLKETTIQYSVALDTANESIVKLQEDLKNAQNTQSKSLTKKQLKDLEELNTIREQLKVLNDSNINLNLQINDVTKNNDLLQNIIKEKDSEIILIKNKNKEIKLPAQNNGVIHTYNIKGFDNRTGLEINGGATYIKAAIIVKMLEDVLYWEVRSLDLDLNINRSLSLISYPNYDNLKEKIKSIGSYVAIKEFLQIPEIVENGFNKNSLLISGGI